MNIAGKFAYPLSDVSFPASQPLLTSLALLVRRDERSRSYEVQRIKGSYLDGSGCCRMRVASKGDLLCQRGVEVRENSMRET